MNVALFEFTAHEKIFRENEWGEKKEIAPRRKTMNLWPQPTSQMCIKHMNMKLREKKMKRKWRRTEKHKKYTNIQQKY